MNAQLQRTKKIVTRILEDIESGQTLTSICKKDGVPSLSTVQRWQRKDDDFDDAVIRARIRGALIQRDMAFDTLFEVMSGDRTGEKGELHPVVTAARDVNHNVVALLSKLDKRFSNKVEVEHTGPMTISWDHGPLSCPNCGYETPVAIEHEAALPIPANDATAVVPDDL